MATGTDIPEPLIGDPAREATASIRGYRYQILRTIYVWLEAAEGEVVYVEGAEDIDRVSGTEAKAVQVKDIQDSGAITLRSKPVVEAISNFWALKSRNPERRIRFNLVTTARIGVEKGQPFGRDATGLSIWEIAAKESDPLRADACTPKIAKFLLDDKRVAQGVRDFLQSASLKEVQEQLIAPMAWRTAEPSGEEVEAAILRKLRSTCWERKIPQSYAEKVLAELEHAVWAVAASKRERALVIDEFYRLFDLVTVVPVPHAALASVIQSMPTFPGLGGLGGMAVESLAVVQGIVRVGLPPPLPTNVLRRVEVERSMGEILGRDAVLNIHGATGSGKTTLVAALPVLSSDSTVWVACRDADPPSARLALSKAGRHVDRRSGCRYLVLDDVDVLSHAGALDFELPGLLYTLRVRGGGVIVTSYRPLGGRLQGRLGISGGSCVQVPPFSEQETGELLRRVGLDDNSRREIWARLIALHTRGHPQLVAARVSALAQSGFPKPSPDDLLATPSEIRDAREEARLILNSRLPVQQRDLLYRLSLLTGPFTRARALALGLRPPPISEPGDAFDLLVGPWIERIGPTEYRVSPLVQNAGSEANGEAWAKEVHAAIAESWLSFREQNQWDVATILFHSVLGGNSRAIARLAIGLMSADENVWKPLGETCSVYVHVYAERGATFPAANPFEGFCARLLQLRLAVHAHPEACVKILDRIDEEFTQDSTDPMIRLMRQFLLSHVVAHPLTLLPLSRLFRTIAQLVELADTLPAEIRGTSLRIPSPDKIFDKEGSFDVAPALGLTLVQRIKTIDELAAATVLINGLATELRVRCLRIFRAHADMGRQLCDSVWLTEHQKKSPNWRALADALRDLFAHTVRWKEIVLGQGVASVLARTVHENLKESAEALEILEGAIAACGHSYLLLDMKAKVLADLGRNEEATRIWAAVLDDWEADETANVIGIAIACRYAGVAASKSGDWAGAARFFARGAASAAKSQDRRLSAGLLADAAYSEWRAGTARGAIDHSWSALRELEQIPNDPRDIRSYYAHKVIGHVMTWMSAQAAGKRARLEAPTPGCCSNLDPAEEVTGLHRTPIEFSWANAAVIAESIGYGNDEIEARINSLGGAPYPAVRMLVAEVEIARLLRTGQVDELLEMVRRLVQALTSVRAQDSDGSKIWEPSRLSEAPEADLAASEPELWMLYICRGLFSLAANGVAVDSTLRSWKSRASAIGAPPGVIQFVDETERICSAGYGEWISASRDASALWARRISAAAMILGPLGADPKVLLLTHGFLLSLNESQLGSHLEQDISRAISKAWLSASERRFALRAPNVHGPSIAEACRTREEGWGKVARIFLAASPAVDIRVPDEVVARARRIGR